MTENKAGANLRGAHLQGGFGVNYERRNRWIVASPFILATFLVIAYVKHWL